MTIEDVKEIVELYHHFEDQYNEWYREWQMDEDQIGVPNPFDKTHEEICEDVLGAYRVRHPFKSLADSPKGDDKE